MSKYSFIILFLFSFFIVNAQVFDRINVPIKINGSFLNHDNVGGLNSPQFNTIDLNFDGVNDLLIFDRVGNVVLPFLTMTESGNKSYHFAPQYKNNFPTIKNWVLLRDFNGDGINDLFTNSEAPPGIIVYKAKNENGVLEYDLVESEHGDYDIIYYNSPSGYLNLYVSTIDYPDINDIDGD
ncbi:MAG: hypothetical protein KBA06_02850, partial [Saprospiraceae bacterium]|nr:hypothetical protein [Saprospiraceae bacterium]